MKKKTSRRKGFMSGASFAVLAAGVAIIAATGVIFVGTKQLENDDLQAYEAAATEYHKETEEAKELERFEETKETEEIKGTEPTKETEEIDIIMVGDILLHDPVEEAARRPDGTYDYNQIFEPMKEEIQEADLAIVNQEVIIGGVELGISGYPCFNADYTMADALVKAGFDIVCHGTNHALDKGRRGLINCVEYWSEKYPQVGVLGINGSEEEYEEIYVYEEDGIKVAVLNYTYGTNGIPLPDDMPYCVDMLKKEKVVEDIKRAEEIADFTVVCPHWGTEYVLKPDSNQEYWTEIFLETGVDLVLGTHPHVIEPVAMITDEATGRQMLVYYSLGNFVNWTGSSGEGIANRMVGGMAQVTIGRDEKGDVVIKEYGVTALVTHLEEGMDKVTTMKLSDYTDELSHANMIVHQDSNFSKEYCVELCKKVWGENWE